MSSVAQATEAGPATCTDGIVTLRIVGLIALIILLPSLWVAVSGRLLRREHAMILLGLSFFAGGFMPTDVALVTWPMWPSPDRGIVLGLPDCIAIVLIGTRPRKFGLIAFKPLFAFHATAIALSILLSAVPLASFFSLFQFGRIFLIFIAVAGEAADIRRITSLFQGLALGLMIEAGTVAWQKAHGVIQAAGTASHQNELAVITELIMLPLLALVLERGRQKLLWLGLLSAFLVLAGGGSRAGLGFALMGIVLALVLSSTHSLTGRKSAAVALIVVAVGIAVPIAMTTLSERFGSGSMITKEEARDALETAARNIADDYPLGIGAGMFVTTSNLHGYAARAGVSWGGGTRAAPVHNAYLLERAELGWLGLITFGALLTVPLFSGLRAVFRRPRIASGGFATGSIAALVIVSFHSLYEYAPVTFECLALIAVNIAVIAGLKTRLVLIRRGQSRRRAAAVPDRPPAYGRPSPA